MKTKMKLLIAYGGLNSMSKTVHDLKRAGLPRSLEAKVLSVADVFVIPDLGRSEGLYLDSTPSFVESARRKAIERTKREIKEAQKTAEEGAALIKTAFPYWQTSAEAVGDSPAWGIVKKAGEWNADLIIVGSRSNRGAGKILLGSVAQTVVREAPCPVRIIRDGVEETDSPSRIVIGVDGSSDSALTVNSVVKRCWKKGTAVHLVTVIDARMSMAAAAPAAKKWMKKQDRQEMEWIHRMFNELSKELKAGGLTVSTLVKEGNPKYILVEEAKRWGADAVFVGARGMNMIERFFIGSVSGAVAERAPCSVEVVRPKQKMQWKNKYKK